MNVCIRLTHEEQVQLERIRRRFGMSPSDAFIFCLKLHDQVSNGSPTLRPLAIDVENVHFHGDGSFELQIAGS